MELSHISDAKEPLKIRGWLILIAIGIIVTPIRTLYIVGEIYPTIFADGTWELLTTRGSEFYSPLWAPIIIIEIVADALFFIIGICLIYLFFTKKRSFPKWYFGLALCSMLFIFLDAYAISFLLPDIEMFDAETTKEIFRRLVWLFVWSPYLFFSKRAKNTFIK
ncbi:DUF2569 domain-containing protein [Vibrio hippocampi]|uniref:DUF2569 domain-containing protein n=1 Tax=Vibrio hippocampi TaxID=654686 RepID=A0ABM8ZGZ3_9VIBR|nr:DUF2569 domain-containing protein [Vibrio hippocampi]CAH0525782.1 hypothetical protein VHP8226_01313 [Vibrio hippocampi]